MIAAQNLQKLQILSLEVDGFLGDSAPWEWKIIENPSFV